MCYGTAAAFKNEKLWIASARAYFITDNRDYINMQFDTFDSEGSLRENLFFGLKWGWKIKAKKSNAKTQALALPLFISGQLPAHQLALMTLPEPLICVLTLGLPL